ncbi:SseB family protein [Micromonospora sp. NPDC092111]|uniref:SseB family protein n=1 Tax=Micromonospora sp. NPDC092111 TaxID=3364289 RepID=UPI00380C51BB
MTDWEPATEAETALRDALRANDQELYFRILARTDLFLPVSAQALAGEVPMGWGTWSTGGRTHVLAFTSAAAMHVCLGATAGPSRRSRYAELAAEWPNHEWWLAVNPGLPIEGYLPAWFVSQLSRGDVRLPGRTMGARARLERAEATARNPADGTPGAEPTADLSAPPVAPWVKSRPVPQSTAVGAVPDAGPSAGGIAHGVARPARTPTPEERSRPAARTSQPDTVPAEAGAGPTAATPAADPTAPGPANAGWPTVSRRRLLGEESAAGPANGRTSFFEPSAVRGAARSLRDNPLRGGERAAPPTRPGLGGQPFPRRRPASGQPVDDDPTRAFRVGGPDEQPTQPIPGPGGATAGQRPDRLAEEPTRAFRVEAPAEEASQALPRRSPAPADPPAEQDRRLTEPTARPKAPRPVDEAADAPPSAAEPVSGPPAARRGFTPIVIEGVILESRDLPVAPPPGPPTDRSDAEDTVNLNGNADLFTPVRPATGTSRPAPPPAAAEPPGPPRPAPDDLWTPAAERVTVTPATGPRPGADAPRATAPADPRPAPRPSTDPAPPSAAGPGPAAPAVAGEPVTVSRPDVPTTAPPTVDPTPTVQVTDPAVPDPATGAEPTLPLPGDRPGSASAPVADPPGVTPPAPAEEPFQPANAVEENLLEAAGTGSTDTFLSTLLLARVLLPVHPDSASGSRPGEPGFEWRTGTTDGETYVVVYTSPERLADHDVPPVETIEVRFVQLIRRWSDPSWSFAVNPGTPVGAKLPGEQIMALANWAAEVGLGDEADVEPEAARTEAPAERTRYAPPVVDPSRPVVMQKAIAPSQLAYYLERGYDRVSGFVHRAGELAHLTTPAELHDALGLGYPDSPFARDAEATYVLRWPAYRPSLYRIPYGGQNEAAMRAMEGWVIERAPFRGNGFAPGESSDVVAEFKVDSARLPHGAQLWRIGADGTERVIAVLDTDALLWRQVGES